MISVSMFTGLICLGSCVFVTIYILEGSKYLQAGIVLFKITSVLTYYEDNLALSTCSKIYKITMASRIYITYTRFLRINIRQAGFFFL